MTPIDAGARVRHFSRMATEQARDSPGHGAAPRRIYRSCDERIVAGVAAGLGHYLRVDPLWMRLAFVVATSAGGLGVLIYAVCWVLLPEAGPGEEERLRDEPRRGGLELVAGALIVLGFLFLLRELGLRFADGVVLPALLVLVGIVLIWQRSSGARRGAWLADLQDLRQRRAPPALTELLGRAPGAARLNASIAKKLLRFLVGVGFLIAGAGMFAAATEAFAEVRSVVIAFAILLVGLGLIFGPWAWRLARELAAERRARIRSQERAEMAAHLHDSVLQTLALIQRHGDDPEQMARLARGQERELRSWLYGGDRRRPEGALATELETLAAEVEDLHGVAVEVVTVGDCELDEDLEALLAAAREAMVNAARLSGEREVSVYLESERHRVSCFVRDRGVGFEPDAVPDDRKGLSESIVGRMRRHGGSATIRTAPGEGTEVKLTLPRRLESETG